MTQRERVQMIVSILNQAHAESKPAMVMVTRDFFDYHWHLDLIHEFDLIVWRPDPSVHKPIHKTADGKWTNDLVLSDITILTTRHQVEGSGYADARLRELVRLAGEELPVECPNPGDYHGK